MRVNLVIHAEKIQKLKWGKSEEVAQAMGIGANTLSRKVRGNLPMTVSEINQLAQILGVNTIELMCETYDRI